MSIESYIWTLLNFNAELEPLKLIFQTTFEVRGLPFQKNALIPCFSSSVVFTTILSAERTVSKTAKFWPPNNIKDWGNGAGGGPLVPGCGLVFQLHNPTTRLQCATGV